MDEVGFSYCIGVGVDHVERAAARSLEWFFVVWERSRADARGTQPRQFWSGRG